MNKHWQQLAGEPDRHRVGADRGRHNPHFLEVSHADHQPLQSPLHLLAASLPVGGETRPPAFRLPDLVRQAKCGVALTAFNPALLDEPDFLELAARLRQQPDSCVWCTLAPPSSRQELREQIAGLTRMADLFLITHGGASIGFAISKRPVSAAFEHWRWIGIVIGEPHQRRGLGLVGLALLAAHLFDSGIARVVGETFGLNLRMLELLDRLPGIKREGVRHNHVRIGNAYFDLHEFGLDREEFQKTIATDRRWARLLG